MMKYAIMLMKEDGAVAVTIYGLDDQEDFIEEFSTRKEAIKFLMRQDFKPLSSMSAVGSQEWVKAEVFAWM